MDHIRHKHRLLSCEYCREEFTRQKMTGTVLANDSYLPTFIDSLLFCVFFLSILGFFSAHLRNVHRAEIDVELAGESDNFYKSKLLNNNNDITQISFNLLNTQIASTANSTCTTTLTSACSSSSSIASSNPSPMSMSSTSNIHMTTAPTTTTTTASSPSPSTSSIQSHNNNNNNNNHHQQQTHLQHQQYQAASLAANNNIFVTDHNSNNLALNGFISSPSPNELNLVSDDTTNANSNTLYMVSTASSSASPETQGHNDNNLDHFMASLMDTEQEITVT